MTHLPVEGRSLTDGEASSHLQVRPGLTAGGAAGQLCTLQQGNMGHGSDAGSHAPFSRWQMPAIGTDSDSRITGEIIMKSALVADDHAVTRRGMRAVIEEMFPAAEVGEASDADGVLTMVGSSVWDFILLDIIMPGDRNILELLHEIRELDATVPILVITAATDLSYVIQSMKAGANGLIHKHLPPEELENAIRKVASGETYLHSETAIAIAKSLQDDMPTLPHERLSARELDILRRLALGRAVKEVAGDLGISDKTVATYVARIRQKTGLANPVEMTRYALQHNLVE